MKSALQRQMIWYGVIGMAQLLIDSLVYVGLELFTGHAVISNVVGRIAGALIGFYLNARITFSDQTQSSPNRLHLLRFLLVWLALTVVSTTVVAGFHQGFGASASHISKPVVEACLAVAGFLISRVWIYR